MKLFRDKFGSFQITFILFVFTASYFLSKELFDSFFAKVSFNILLTLLGYFVSIFFKGLNKWQMVLIYITSFVLFAVSVYYLNKVDTSGIEFKVNSLRSNSLDFVGEWETKQNGVNFNLLFNSKEDVLLKMSPENINVYFKYRFESGCIAFLDTSNLELRMSWCIKVKNEDFFTLVEDGDTITFFKRKD